MKIKPKSEISSHITLMSGVSGLFPARYLHPSRLLVFLGVKLAVKFSRGSQTPPADTLAAALSWLGRLHYHSTVVVSQARLL